MAPWWFAKANVDEMKDIFGFLHALHSALDQLLLNGYQPNVTPYAFEPESCGRSDGAGREGVPGR